MCIISTFLLLYKILLDKSPVPQPCLSFLIKTLHFFPSLFFKAVYLPVSSLCHRGAFLEVLGLSGWGAWAQWLQCLGLVAL